MDLKEFYQRFQLDESLVKETGFNPYYCQIESELRDPIIVQGKEFINLAANNYLGLANDPRVKEEIIRGVQKYGASLCGTPIATGYIDLFKTVEQKLARFIGLEEAIILPSGYQANNGVFPAVAGKEDLIIVDHFAHSSLLQGIKTVGCKIKPFLHNNLEHLGDVLARSKGYRQVFVVTESVFSTEGSIAPFKEIVALCAQYEAVPVVDDSHGIGVIGKAGRGILEHQNIIDYQGIYTASLGKALANAGGVISGRKSIIDHLRYYCSHLVYSTALTPGVLAGVEATLDIIGTEFPAISNTMWKYHHAIRESLTAAGFKIASGEAPINSIIAGTSKDTILMAKKFYENGILTTPFIAPSVPANEGKVRLIAGANLKEENVNRVVNIIKGIK
jgi:7-keto-8-aminopelargonate synthetase-like enzyme